MRVLLAVALVMSAVVPIAESRSTIACSFAPERIDDTFRDATGIAVVDVIRVGDGVNRAPAATPTSSPIAPTATPRVSTPAAGIQINLTPSATLTAAPSPTPRVVVDFDLRGYGADVRVKQLLAGALPHEFAADAAVRAGIEQTIRQMEAQYGLISSCPLGGLMPRYREGATYIALYSTVGEDDQLYTARLFELRGDQVVNPGGIGMTLAVYRAHFDGLAADVSQPHAEGDPRGSAYVWEAQFAASLLYRAIAALRASDVVIVPPDAGGAGLKEGVR